MNQFHLFCVAHTKFGGNGVLVSSALDGLACARRMVCAVSQPLARTKLKTREQRKGNQIQRTNKPLVGVGPVHIARVQVGYAQLLSSKTS